MKNGGGFSISSYEPIKNGSKLLGSAICPSKNNPILVHISDHTKTVKRRVISDF